MMRPGALEPDQLADRLLAVPEGTPLSPAEILVRSATLYKSDSGSVATGTWESEAGVAEYHFDGYGEIVYIVSGSVTVQEVGGEPLHLEAGTAAAFPVGWRGTWTVHDRVRKFAVIYK